VSVKAGQLGQHVRRDVAEVGQHAQAAGAVGAAQLQRLARIVRHGKGLHCDVADRKLRIVSREIEPAFEIPPARGEPGAFAHPDRNAIAA
jgi:hypothetical protein